MAASPGYNCEFVDSASEDSYCKKCNLVARRMVFVSCCEETFCYACIAAIQQEGQPCLECDEEEFTLIELKKYQTKLLQCQVYCSMKERGCAWCENLDKLDSHLDNCQYVDTKCPLNCQQVMPKYQIEEHVAQECAKRPYACQHCGFKDIYEKLINTHLPECPYVPQQCPNSCGVSSARKDIIDHLKTCRLQEMECKFRSVGCEDHFTREDKDEHATLNIQKHLTLTASLAVGSKEQLQQMLLDLDRESKEEISKLKTDLGEQDMQIGDQEKKIMELQKQLGEQKKKCGEQEEKLRDQERKAEDQEKKIRDQEEKLNKLEKEFQESKTTLSDCIKFLHPNQRFVMNNFTKEKEEDQVSKWKSPAMYTHLFGYKFYIGVDANGCGGGQGRSIYVDLWPIPGEFDDKLQWPANVQFTIELINQQGGKNTTHTRTCTWGRKTSNHFPLSRIQYGFIEHSELNPFLADDALYFYVSNIKLM